MRLLRSMHLGLRSPIGLTVDGRSLAAVQAEGHGRSSSLVAASTVRRTDPDAAVTTDELVRFADVLARQGFRGRRVAVAVPAEDLLVETLELPPMDSGAPIDRLARMELAAAHRLPPHAFEFGGWDVTPAARRGSSSNGTRLLAVGCPHPKAEAVAEQFAAGGFEVVHVAAAPCALSGACRDLAAGADAQTVILDVGWRHVHLSVLHAGRLVSVRVLPDLGIGAILAPLARTQALDPRSIDRLVAGLVAEPAGGGRFAGGSVVDPLAVDPALIRPVHDALEAHVRRLESEVRLSVAYVAQEHGNDGPRRMLVTGDGAECPALVHELGEATGLETIAADPIQLGARAGCTAPRHDAPSVTLAWALAVDAPEGDA